MLIECPRCGFEQPKDQFCAKCGLDIDSYVAKPKPALVRLIQNPNFHLSLIGILIVLVIGYILFSPRGVVTRQLRNDYMVSSRDAGDPDDPRNNRPARAMRPASAPPAQAPVAEMAAAAGGAELTAAEGKSAENDKDATAVKLTPGNKLEVTHWEVPREIVANLIPLAEKLGESNGGRAYFYPIGNKIGSEIQSAGQRMSLGRTVATRTNSQISLETPPATAEAFQFGMLIQITKVENKDLSLKWDAQLVLPQIETAAEAASAQPAVRSLVDTSLSGRATMNSNGLLMIVMEPTNRTPREEFLVRAGEGPWSIFSSPEFRAGLTDWVITVQIK